MEIREYRDHVRTLRKGFGFESLKSGMSAVETDPITPDLARALAGGMEILVGVLGTFTSQDGEDLEVH